MRRSLPLPLAFLAVLLMGVLLYLVIDRRAWRDEAPAQEPAADQAREAAPAAKAGETARPGTAETAPAGKATDAAKPRPRPTAKHAGPPTAAIIMDDLGNSLEPMRELCALGAKITPSILPFAAATGASAQAARECGLEVMLHLPLESLVPPSRTPEGTITSSMSPDEVRRGVLACLDQVLGCVGVNNHAGSRTTEDGALMPAILEVLREKGLYFVDSRTTAASLAYETALTLGVRAAERRVFLDGVLDDAAIKSRLEELFRTARETGRAIGICHPKPETFAALRKYLGLAADYGVTLVFASAMVE